MNCPFSAGVLPGSSRFSPAVDAGKRLFVQQAVQPVAHGDLFHRFHDQLVLVGRDVGAREDGRELVLAGRHLVVLGFGEDA